MTVQALSVALPADRQTPRADWVVNFELTPDEQQKLFEITVREAEKRKGKTGVGSYTYYSFEQDGGFTMLEEALTPERYEAWNKACEEAGEWMGESFTETTFRAEIYVFGEVVGE